MSAHRHTGWVDPEIMDRLKSDENMTTPVEAPPPGHEPNVYTSQMIRRPGDEAFLDPSILWHMPVLDIDHDAELVPSSTPGHFHLYLNVPVPHEAYMRLLDALHECGIIGHGYHHFSKERGYTVVRMPHSRKRICCVEKLDGSTCGNELPCMDHGGRTSAARGMVEVSVPDFGRADAPTIDGGEPEHKPRHLRAVPDRIDPPDEDLLNQPF